MNDILLVVPSRARPHNARALITAWEATTEGRSDLLFLVDHDDGTRWQYMDVCNGTGAKVEMGTPARLVEWTNRAALDRVHRYRVFGSIGDDHRPESTRWESAILGAIDAMGGTGIAYGNDGVHGESIPTAFFTSADIVQALGYMVHPTIEHLFADDFTRELGRAAGCIRYLPRVAITHYHPLVGRAPNDATYERGNSADVWARDRAAYDAWMADGLAVDAAKVRALRAPAAVV